jgi:transmembrane protein 17
VFNIVSYIVILFWGMVEWIRLYYGYSGNIKESFPELAAFLILTCLFTIPLLGALFIPFGTSYAIEMATKVPQILFIIFEIIFGIGAIRHLVKN